LVGNSDLRGEEEMVAEPAAVQGGNGLLSTVLWLRLGFGDLSPSPIEEVGGGRVATSGGVAGEQPQSWVTGGQEGWMAVEARGEPEEEGKVEVSGQAREEDGGGGL
jgi:hypothetical protein